MLWVRFQMLIGVSFSQESFALGRLCLWAALLSFSMAPAHLSSAPSASTADHRLLEENIWTSDYAALSDFEGDTAKLIQSQPRSAFGHYLLAQLYLRQFKGNPSQLKLLKQASELGQQAMELNPEQDFGYLIASQVLDIMGYSENAIGILQGDEKIKLQASWRTHFLRAQLLSAQHADDSAIASYEDSLREKDAIGDIVIPYFIASLKSKFKGLSLIEELNQKKSQYNHRLFDLSRAMAYADNEDYLTAHKIFLKLEQEYPKFYEARIQDAVLLSGKLNRPKEAEVILRRIVKEDFDGLSRSQQGMSKAHLASVLLTNRTNARDSQHFFIEAITETENSMEWIAFAQRAYEKNKQLQDFIVLLDGLKSKIPASGYLYALQGEIQSESLSQHDLAVNSFRSAIILDPERSEFYNGLGLAYYRMNNYAEALKVFFEAIRIDPQDATSRYNHACVLAILGRSDEAIGSLKEAIGLDPRLQQTARNDKDFAGLRDMQSFRFITESRSSAAAAPLP